MESKLNVTKVVQDMGSSEKGKPGFGQSALWSAGVGVGGLQVGGDKRDGDWGGFECLELWLFLQYCGKPGDGLVERADALRGDDLEEKETIACQVKRPSTFAACLMLDGGRADGMMMARVQTAGESKPACFPIGRSSDVSPQPNLISIEGTLRESYLTI
ncbi:hypothetical protein PG993_005640 [Apiospora rasikravindrae]|uniref:Uncharacterized protein n=1 Tax=Apiospora rasikravindrae TaxID=990691 RepID=A0ABR1TG58_9PEZI